MRRFIALSMPGSAFVSATLHMEWLVWGDLGAKGNSNGA